MAKANGGSRPHRRRAPVVQVQRCRRARGARPRSSADASSRRQTTHPAPASAAASPTTRAERAERRGVARRLADAGRLARQLADAKRSLAVTERSLAESERSLTDARRQLAAAEKERDELRDEQDALWDQGTELWQNVWDDEDVSGVLTFPTKKSVICGSVEHCHGGNSMPGVHALGDIDKGRVTQSIWLKGMGYALVGLVTSEAEKHAVCHTAGHDFAQLPLMKPIFSRHHDEREGDVFTIEVDMTERRAKLFVSDRDAIRLAEPQAEWTGLPERVWVAVAFKRNSGREAVLMPCIATNLATE